MPWIPRALQGTSHDLHPRARPSHSESSLKCGGGGAHSPSLVAHHLRLLLLLPTYQVLVDGNFIHAVMSMKLGDAKDVVIKYLGAPSKLFTTRCVKEELKNMGKELKEASFYSRKLDEVKDGSDPPAPALDSIVAAVENGNSERFIVCTQDDKLRKRLLATSPMTPVVFCHTSGLQMEPPADAEGSGVASQKEHGAGLTEGERNALGQEEVVRGAKGVRTNVRYKKPKARGPNPLSVKKKIGKESAPRGEGGGAKKKRKRRGGADN